MKPSLTVLSSERLCNRYRELLLEEWTRDTLEAVLLLLWDEIRESAEKGNETWIDALRPKQGRFTSRDFNQEVIDRIRKFSDILPDAGFPTMPASFSEKRSSKALKQAERSWTFLILQSLATIKGDADLFCDTQSLLFFSDLHFLLPNLKEQGCDSEHDCLLNAMYMHIWLVWREERPQLLYLGSQLRDYLGQRGMRDRMLLESFKLTPPEDHTFLTKAQDHWSNLIEERRLKEAIDFLFSVRERSLPSHREEIDQMVDYTMANHHDQPA
jgi:hypothetical protein